MEKAKNRALSFGFENMSFHACDIEQYTHQSPVDAVFSLHACDTATDKTIYLGIHCRARLIFSVSCCQHSLKKTLKGHPFAALTRHQIFKDRLTYMVGDSLRSLLIEMQGYRSDIIEFVSSRSTDKNVMIRCERGQQKSQDKLRNEYEKLQGTFNFTLPLEAYLKQGN